ncbi:MAG: DUF1003 domain-containing protein [Bacteroidales bacterium]
MKQNNKESIRHLVSQIMNTVDTKEREETIHLLLSKQASKDTNTYTQAQSIADKLSKVAGSWGFIISFCLVIILWIIVNIYFFTHPFDPYPFILLNLVLSCLAALQAPIILMSQNRQEDKDRERAENDYKVNLKAEIILEDLHLKMDYMISEQKRIKEKIEKIAHTKE